MSNRIVNKLYGHKGNINVLDNNTCVLLVKDQPEKIIPINKLTEAIEELAVYATSNGHIQLGTWDHPKDPL